jgi:rhamnosyltransferase
MRRLVIFAHYDAQAEVKRYVTFLLSKVAACCDRIVFVSTSALAARELAKVEPHCAEALLRDNSGYDFATWRTVLEQTDLGAWDEIVLMNSSVLGPVGSLDSAFSRMDQVACDFWGMTENHEIAPHIQSYFLAFRQSALRSPSFGRFWGGVLPYRDKKQVIRSYEVGLTRFLVENGLRSAVLASLDSLSIPLWQRMGNWRETNPCSSYPIELLERGMPFVKIELLRDNPKSVPLSPVYRAMQRAGYDLDMVEFDRPVQRRLSLRILMRDGLRALAASPGR